MVLLLEVQSLLLILFFDIDDTILILPHFRFIGLNSKISPTKVDGEWWNNFCSLQNHSINALVLLKNCVTNALIAMQCMRKVHALVNFLLILACNDLLHLEI